jgi:L-lactate dehydrogenase (cytochrome)
MNLQTTYPGLSDLKDRTRRRIPHFVFEYLDSGTGDEATLRRNRQALDDVLMMPSILHGPMEPDLSTEFLGQTLPVPFGIAPVGMSGLVWPGAEAMLARSAAEANIPFCLSTVAAASPMDIAPHLGQHGWFQLYPPKDLGILRDMLNCVREAGFRTVVLTADVPVASRRERQARSGLTQPPRLTPRLLWQAAQCPAWALGMARRGMPRMRFLDRYTQDNRSLPPNEHIGYLLRTSPDWSYLAELRNEWNGPVIVKGVMDPVSAAKLAGEGVDAIWVSNHAGRQFNGAPAAIEMLPRIREVTDLPLIFDSGVTGGLDILRAIALGANLVMLGRAWHYALAALGDQGPAHLVDMLKQDLIANMGQLGTPDLASVAGRLHPPL